MAIQHIVTSEAIQESEKILVHIAKTLKASLAIVLFRNGAAYVVYPADVPSEFPKTYFKNLFDCLANYFARNNNRRNDNDRDCLVVTHKNNIGLHWQGLEMVKDDFLVLYPLLENGKEVEAIFVASIAAQDHLAGDKNLLVLLTKLLQVHLSPIVQNRFGSEEDEDEVSGEIVGISPPIEEIRRKIGAIAQTSANVLIYGESGTGKELAARNIHKRSPRAALPFVGVDCVSLPPSLIESELFGYEKGSFTGANKSKEGLLEMANGGTFFLDEIAELGCDLQAKLLRVLQERQVRRIGGNELRPLNIRVVAATNMNPEDAVTKGKLREDLYFRLNVVPLYLPALRERRDDIRVLVNLFVKQFSSSYQMKAPDFAEEAIECLTDYSWPGNVRELKNVVERIMILSGKSFIGTDDLPLEIRLASVMHCSFPTHGAQPQGYGYAEGKRFFMSQFERNYFTEVLRKYQGNISKVADEVGLSRKTLYQIFRKIHLDYRKFRAD